MSALVLSVYYHGRDYVSGSLHHGLCMVRQNKTRFLDSTEIHDTIKEMRGIGIKTRHPSN